MMHCKKHVFTKSDICDRCKRTLKDISDNYPRTPLDKFLQKLIIKDTIGKPSERDFK